jgi:ADP-heptose:LPS heptosyltransferase
VVALPCFHLIRRTNPGSKITLLTNLPVLEKAAPAIAILENSGLCDDAIHYPVATRKLSELTQVRQKIRELRPDLFVNLAAGRGLLKSLRDVLFFRSCGIKRMVGTPLRNRDLRVQQMKESEYEPESLRLVSRLSALGEVDLADRQFWQLRITGNERDQAADLLPSRQSQFIAVSVGTKVHAKDWGEENWFSLLTLLSEAMPDVTLILLGSPDEWDRSEKMSRAWAGNCANLCGKTPPRISAAVLERCGLFIGHDSGPAHLAGVVGVPTLALFSWHNPPGQWFPGHRSWKSVKVLYPPLPKGGWTSELQMKRSVSEGILLLQPGLVLKSALELWQRRHESQSARN